MLLSCGDALIDFLPVNPWNAIVPVRYHRGRRQLPGCAVVRATRARADGAARLRETTAGELKRALSFATTWAAFTVGRVDADPPRRADLSAEVFDFLLGQTT